VIAKVRGPQGEVEGRRFGEVEGKSCGEVEGEVGWDQQCPITNLATDLQGGNMVVAPCRAAKQ
jgi:hypothetical protein